jgi:hypothetical protein
MIQPSIIKIFTIFSLPHNYNFLEMNRLLSILKRPILATFFGVLVILALHFVFPSYINGLNRNVGLEVKYLWDSEHADQVLNERAAFSEFARRPITSGIQVLLNQYLEFPYQFSFNLIVFVSLFLSCLVIKNIFSLLNQSYSIAHISIYGFLFSYATLFAFMAPMHTYDEPLQFLFILLAFFFYLKMDSLAAALLFSFACIVRESSFILFPFFLLTEKRSFRLYFYWFLPLLIYVLFFRYALPDWVQRESIYFNSQNRLLGWTENFKNWKSSLISITNLFLVLALPILLIRKNLSRLSNQSRIIFRYSEWLLYLNAFLVLVSGLAKEPRLFALPLVLIWPLLPESVNKIYTSYCKQKVSWLVISLIATLSFMFSFLLFGSALGKGGILFKAYLFVYLLVWLSLLFNLHKEKSTL